MEHFVQASATWQSHRSLLIIIIMLINVLIIMLLLCLLLLLLLLFRLENVHSGRLWPASAVACLAQCAAPFFCAACLRGSFLARLQSTVGAGGPCST